MTEPNFTRTQRVFSMLCSVEVGIHADREIVWSLLTDAENIPRWNSTVSRIEGRIREGERLRVHVPGSTQTFTPLVSNVGPQERMTWAGGIAPIFKGVRTFVLTPRESGSTDFAMEERFSGAVFALVKNMFPDFRPIFEAYARDLKREAERVASERAMSDRP